MNNIFKVVSAIIATLIGAGFASGQEINTFFYSYGKKGIIGLVICALILMCIIYRVFIMITKKDIKNYKELLYFLVGNNAFIINLFVNIFIIVTFFIMIAGFGAYFSQEVGISTYIGSGILSILCFFTFLTNSNGIIKISALLVPILVLFISYVGFINISSINIIDESILLPNSGKLDWLLSSILYSSYNSILLIPVLITLKKHIKHKNIAPISILSAIVLFTLAINIFFLLTKVNIDINKLEMPVIYVVSHFFTNFKQVYAFIILASIYTTAISIGMSFLENLVQNKTYYPLFVLILCITGFIISGFGFSNLVAKLYPIFGYLGLIQISLLFLKK